MAMKEERRWVANRITKTINRFKKFKSYARPVYHALQDIQLRGLLAPNATLHNIHSGKRCIVFGTGSSLIDMDLSVFANEYTFSCNEIFQHRDFSKLNLDFYTVVEPFYGRMYGAKYLEDIYKLYAEINNAFRDKNPIMFFDATLHQYFREQHFLEGKRLHYVLPKEPVAAARVLAGDFTKRITFADGAIFTMIAASIYMGFSEIYLVGCGYTCKPVHQFHFYDHPHFSASLTEQQRKEWVDVFLQNNPQSEIYRQREVEGEVRLTVVSRRPDDFYRQHRVVKKYAESQGVRIINAIPEGFESPVYDSVSVDYLADTIIKA